MCLNGLRCSQNAGKWQFESTKFQIFLGEHAPKPPSLVGANHSRKILEPPLQCCTIAVYAMCYSVINPCRYWT